ncbi:class I adenylate-forming enzyme family protein [Hydrogenophaga sp.]|uniref:class I adenylate-forming enzyme family protein n=1 Tax=Hydrogenophaga sp. TaxID=1904254 RepID=UPI00271CCF9D|nr:class I adenylate-forming enzyme family protein [Hydrogenophaga sp.]MDO9435525.1 class I adenylate-forming enzyme family protein [Hydrogenophaga sp.]
MTIKKNTVLTLLGTDEIQHYTASGHWRDETIYASALLQAQARPDSFAIRDGANRLTYGQLLACADALAARLSIAGVQPGQRVGLWSSSRVETAIVWLACSRNGYTCVPSLHRDHTVGDVHGLMQRVRAAAFIGQSGWGADAARRNIFELLADVDTLRLTIDLASDAPAAQLLAPANVVSEAEVCTDPNRVVYLAFTSGTTGEPKGVMHSDNTLLSNARAIAKDWDFGPQSVLYTMSPLSHNLGLGAMISAFATGAEVVVHDAPRGASLVDRLVDTNASFLFGVPTHAIDVLNELRARGLKKLGRLEGFRVSGASAPPDVVAGLIEHGVMPQSGYGMTEACSHHYTLRSDPPDRIINTSGRACPGYEVQIFSTEDPDRALGAGEIGQIGGRGASLMLGYFDNQQATEESFNAQGWFMTGDLGKLTEDGYLVITGRKKDLIIRGGHNIYPARIENLALQHAAVARAAVLPVPDTRLGEKVCLAVMYKPGQSASADVLLQHLDEAGLSRYDMPEYFVALDDIPLTASGKIFKRGLVDDVKAGRLDVTPVQFKPATEAVS